MMLGMLGLAPARAQGVTQYYWAEKADGSKIECHPGPTGANDGSWGVLTGGGLDVAWAVKATSPTSSNVAIEMQSGNRKLIALIAGYGTGQPQIMDGERQPRQPVCSASGQCRLRSLHRY